MLETKNAGTKIPSTIKGTADADLIAPVEFSLSSMNSGSLSGSQAEEINDKHTDMGL